MTAGTPREGVRPGRASWKKGCLSGSLGDTHMFTQVAGGAQAKGLAQGQEGESHHSVLGELKSLALIWGEGQTGWGCYAHRTLERSARQMEGSLIRDQALVIRRQGGRGRKGVVPWGTGKQEEKQFGEGR